MYLYIVRYYLLLLDFMPLNIMIIFRNKILQNIQIW